MAKCGFVCYNDEPLDIKAVWSSFELGGLKDLQGSRIDDFAFIVSKWEKDFNVLILKTEIQELKEKFKHVIPWTKHYKVRFIRRFELLGVPLECWTDETIKKIGSVIGEVKDICYKHHNFSSVEIVILMECTNPML